MTIEQKQEKSAPFSSLAFLIETYLTILILVGLIKVEVVRVKF